MKFFEFKEILLAVFCSAAFGGIFGGIYPSFNLVLEGIISIFRLPVSLFQKSLKTIVSSFKKSNGHLQKSKYRRDIFDFIYFLILGFGYALLTYLLLDGIFRLYMLVFFAVGFVFSKKTLGAFFERILTLVIKLVYIISTFVLFAFVFPIKHISGLFVLPIFKALYRLFSKYRSKALLSKKIRRIKKLT